MERLVPPKVHYRIMTGSTIYRRRIAGDPKECRKHALRCYEFAHSLPDDRSRQTFADLGKAWLRLAIEVENSHALLDALINLPPQPGVASLHLLVTKATEIRPGERNG